MRRRHRLAGGAVTDAAAEAAFGKNVFFHDFPVGFSGSSGTVYKITAACGSCTSLLLWSCISFGGIRLALVRSDAPKSSASTEQFATSPAITMPRSIWKGSISFGLVHIPVALYPAVNSDDIDFDWLEKRTMAPIGYRR